MKIRTTYIVLGLLMAVSLLSLDRLLKLEHQNRQEQMVEEVSIRALNRARDFFQTRMQIMQSLACQMSTQEERNFEQTAQALLSPLSGIEEAGLFSSDGRRLQSWRPAYSEYPDVADPLSNAASLKTLFAETASAQASLGPTFSLSGGFGFLAFAPVGQAPYNYYAAALIRLPLLGASSHDASSKLRHVVCFEDPEGRILSSSACALHGPVGMRQGFMIRSQAWAVHTHPPPGDAAPLLFMRTSLAAFGIVLLLCFAAIYFLHQHQHAALIENGERLQNQVASLEQHNQRLLALNKELDDFTYVVSHDLKEPLRGIEGVSRVFVEEYGHLLDDAGREYLATIRNSGVRMRRLVDDLLRLSRITRRRYPYEEAHFAEIVNEATEALRYALARKGATVRVQPDLPVVTCDRVRIVELLQNLISNAVKFTGDRPPLVEISYELTTEGHCFRVRDNGIGIRQEDYGRIFEIFQQLKAKDDVEGTGVGLTICKRIVENHGGRIWVESEVGVGTQFFFVFPLHPAPLVPGDGHWGNHG